MIRLIFFCSLFLSLLHADLYSEFSLHMKNKEYKKACEVGRTIFFNQERDEKFISLIGQACLKADSINTLAFIQSRLRESEYARQNAALFSSLVLQKRLIYQFMYDNTDISSLSLPISDHPLSIAFVAIRDNTFTLTSKEPKIIQFSKDDKIYKLYIDDKKNGRITIEIKDKNNEIEIHRYL